MHSPAHFRDSPFSSQEFRQFSIQRIFPLTKYVATREQEYLRPTDPHCSTNLRISTDLRRSQCVHTRLIKLPQSLLQLIFIRLTPGGIFLMMVESCIVFLGSDEMLIWEFFKGHPNFFLFYHGNGAMCIKLSRQRTVWKLNRISIQFR